MTIDELFERPNTQGLTQAEVEAVLAPYFPITRPGKVPDGATLTMKQTNMAPELAEKLERLRAQAPSGLLGALKSARQ